MLHNSHQAFKGKIYLLTGNLNDLRARYEQDFGL